MGLLVPAAAGPSLIVCSTCGGPDGSPGGVRLAELLRDAAAQSTDIAVETMPCLFACAQHCTVYLRCPGRIGYVLGRFAPDAHTARALLDFALAYSRSDEGEVPYAEWPEGVRGHFLVRVPPEGAVVG